VRMAGFKRVGPALLFPVMGRTEPFYLAGLGVVVVMSLGRLAAAPTRGFGDLAALDKHVSVGATVSAKALLCGKVAVLGASLTHRAGVADETVTLAGGSDGSATETRVNHCSSLAYRCLRGAERGTFIKEAL
jgi:hypothetical protein